MSKSDVDLLALIGDDQSIVTYRPRWNQFTGSINATILLQQVVYRWVKHGRRPFYKFSAACNHRAYRPGDSWQEELGMSRYEFESARKQISIKTRGNLERNALVSFWVTADRKTWYALNEAKLVALLTEIYPSDDDEVAMQGQLLMLETDISPMLETDISPMLETDISPMLETNISPMLETDISINNKDYSKDYSRENSKNNSNAGPNAAVAVAILDWMGFTGRLTKKDKNPSPPLLLAWAFWVKLKSESLAQQNKNPVGIARSGWRNRGTPGGGLGALARRWLALDENGRLALLDAAEQTYGPMILTRELEDLGIPLSVAQTFFELWRVTDGAVAPPELMPELQEY